MTPTEEKLLNDIISKYKSSVAESPSDHIELELRFKDINHDAFESIFKAIKHNPDFAPGILDCSINIISENVYERNVAGKSDNNRYIRTITYSKGAFSSDKYSSKSRISRSVVVKDYIDYSVGLSKESDSRKFSTSTNAMVRIKARVGFNYLVNNVPTWRLDLTAVRQGSFLNIGPSLKTIKDDLFTSKLTSENFLDELNSEVIDSYEVELEYIGSDLTIESFQMAKKLFTLINPQYLEEIAYQDEIYHIATHIIKDKYKQGLFKQSSHGLKQLLNQAIALSKAAYYESVFPPVGWLATVKVDGGRCVISINGNRCRILLSNKMFEYILGTEFTPGDITIADAELVWDEVKVAKDNDGANEGKAKPGPSGGKYPKYTLFIMDVMKCNNIDICDQGLAMRKEHIPEVVNITTKFTDDSMVKEYKQLTVDNLEAVYRNLVESEYKFPTDGIIISESDAPYMSTKNYKWKPYDQTTIDFLAMKCPQKLLGIKPYEVRPKRELYLLFVGINHQMREKMGLGFIPQYKRIFPTTEPNYYPIQFSPSASPIAYLYYHDPKDGAIDRQIVELGRNADNTDWIFHRHRADRKMEKNYFGNDFRIAELTFLNYIDKFALEDLWTISDSYFTKTASNIYNASNKFKRFVISILLKTNLSNAKWVIDAAAGRGGDLHRYQEIGVENALFIDIDSAAIAELVRRKFAFFSQVKRHNRNWYNEQKQGGASFNPGVKSTVVRYDRVTDTEYEKIIVKDVKSLTVHTLVADLKTPAEEIIANTFQFGLNPGMVDGVICNFALHYMCDTIEHMRNMLIFVAKMLNAGGVFIFTVMDGKRVFDLLKPLSTGQQWESRENNVLKYAIRKDYAGDKLTPSGQTISVLLPFSDEMYSEPLCNVDVVLAEAKKLGFEQEMNSSMTSMLDKFAKVDRALYEMLTKEDKEYIDFHKYVSLRLVKPRGRG